MKTTDLKKRTAEFALEVIQLTEALPRSRVSDVLGRQLLRAGTSVGANYRSVGRAQSIAHMISKLSLVEEEADECGYWLELLTAAGLLSEEVSRPLKQEASELTAIMVASKKRLKARANLMPRRPSKFVLRSSDGES